MVNFFEAITSTPITFTELPASASFLAFSARYLFNTPSGPSMTTPARDFRVIKRKAYQGEIEEKERYKRDEVN